VAQTIVIGIEPGTGERVAWIGGELALRLGARVVLAHVRSDPTRLPATGDRERARHRSARRGRETFEAPRAALPPDVEFDQRVELGGVVSRLGDVAEEEDAALMVVGSRGRGSIASALFGSVSQTLAREAPCPVMIVPPAPIGTPRPFEGPAGERATTIAGTDGPAASSPAAHFAGALADGLDHRLVVVRLRDSGRSRVQALHAISATENARMIVVGAEEHDGGRARHARSLAARLLRLSRCPVTVVPHGATTEIGARNGWG
jgi:nucleotide-binding universal stress UspA family protein